MQQLRETPRREYQRRLESCRADLAREQRRSIQVGNLRLALAIFFVVVFWFTIITPRLSGWWLAAPIVPFLALMTWHARIEGRNSRLRRIDSYYELGLARIEDRWAGQNPASDRFRDPQHLYAEDLDLFGKGSLFELMSTARTRAGEEILAGWLKSAAPADVVRERQEAVLDLRDRLDLREDLSVLGETIRKQVHPDELARWAEAPAVLFPSIARLVALVLVLVNLGLGIAWLVDVLPNRIPAIAAVMAVSIYHFFLRRRIVNVVGVLGLPAHDLDLLAGVLARFERERFSAPLLIRLQAELDTGGAPASARIAQLQRLVTWLDAARNQFFAPIAFLLLWVPQFAMAIEGWRRQFGGRVKVWLDTAGALEALCSISSYTYERPEDTMPILHEVEGGVFDGMGVGHPLLPAERVIRNDVRLGGDLRVLVVSGSNMSGKSTLLRAVGLNTVLALAGAPVRASRLTLSPLAVGASLRTLDSLQDGRSRFYAEITRLREVTDLVQGRVTAMFLLDELLSGTNSHDRRIGAEGIVNSLVNRGAIGMVTTHDLALAHIAESLGGRGRNVHFEDHIEDGKITFDYQLRPGVVERSNALELMRAVGLNV